MDKQAISTRKAFGALRERINRVTSGPHTPEAEGVLREAGARFGRHLGRRHRKKILAAGGALVAAPVLAGAGIAAAAHRRHKNKKNMSKTASDAYELGFSWFLTKEGKNRLAKAIDMARSGTGNAYQAANAAAKYENIQKATKPIAQRAAGRFSDVQAQIRKMPKLKPAAIGLLKEKRL